MTAIATKPGRNIAGMNRLELTRLIRTLAAERDQARKAATYWRRLSSVDYRMWSPQQTTDYAAAILAEIGPDPKAAEHLDDLAFEVEAHDLSRNPRAKSNREARPGPRCHKGIKWCGKPLNGDGLCSRHDWKRITKARVAA
jgi:hypothetical protein